MSGKILKNAARKYLDILRVPLVAKVEFLRDFRGLPEYDPGVETAIDEGIAWLCRAQDNSLSHDGGVARQFSLISGWAPSYPETTGYIIPTFIEYAKLRGDGKKRFRAKRMLDWLVSIQFAEGGFQGGTIYSKPVLPTTFNTGQILLGLAAGVREFGEEYREPMNRAANWLVRTQDDDGCWTKFPTPFASPGLKAYETCVAWGLLEAARVECSKSYADAALANVKWALKFQKDNGWFENCCLSDPSKPLTHTLGYVFRGILEAYQFCKDCSIFNACKKFADGLLMAIHKEGLLPGRLLQNWQGVTSWACLTGSAQVAICLFKMYEFTRNADYLNAAYNLNQYVRRTMKVSGPDEIKGAIKGSFPVYGEYGPYEYLNWACKFVVDANIVEKATREQ